MNAAIVVIGDELLIGQVVDTNSSWISRCINPLGLRTKSVLTVGDNRTDIRNAIERSFELADIVFMTGGLGPTKDDITKSVLCEIFNSSLILNESVLENVRLMLEKRGILLTSNNHDQAMVPACATVIQNAVGTAPGMIFEKSGKFLFVMPGVPFEMQYLMTNEIVPFLQTRIKLPPVYHKTLLLTGIAESILSEKIATWEDNLAENVSLAYLPAYSSIRLRLSVYNPRCETENYIATKIKEFRLLVGDHILAEEDVSLEELLGRFLNDRHATISTAESCTGGRVASLITAVPGSSDYYKGTVVSYSNSVKSNVLNVQSSDIEQFGAVSETVAKQMAVGVKRLLKTDYSIATTGIAGPGGGSLEKPVGTVWIAVSTPQKTLAQKFVFGNNRKINIERFSAATLATLLNCMKEEK